MTPAARAIIALLIVVAAVYAGLHFSLVFLFLLFLLLLLL